MYSEAIHEALTGILKEWLYSGKEENILRARQALETAMKKNTTLPVITVGTSTCGRIAGSLKTLEAVNLYLMERQVKATVIEVGCMGLCSAEPVLDVQLPGKARISFRHVTSARVPHLLDDILHREVPVDDMLGQYRDSKAEPWREVPYLDQLPYFRNQSRQVLKDAGLIDPSSIAEYIAAGGYKAYVKAISRYTPAEVCNLVEQSQLRGRAGAGFPAGKKWKTALQTQADRRYVICNAQESDPGAFLDRNIIESNPHKLIEGLAIACYAIGAAKGYIYIRSEYRLAIELIRKAIQDARELNLLGDNAMQSGFRIELEVKQGPGAFVCGEETALIGNLEGKRGMPQMKPPYPSESGLFKKPTIINNVESLCNVPDIILKGPDWFQSAGTETSKGTKIFALSGKSKRSGVIEVPMGTSLRKIVYDIAGGTTNGKKFKAVQLGGPSGWPLPEKLLDTPVDFEALKSVGAGMGSGGFVVLDESVCMVDMAGFFMDFMQKQSCGKCIPCREGTKRMREILEGISRKPVDHNGHATLERFKGVMQLETIAEVMKDTSLCGLGVNASNPVLGSLRWFRDEFEEHIFDRHCKSGVCRELRSYRIAVDKCTGCSLCAKRCPENAIIGTELKPFFIVEERCSGCGICHEVCKFGAVKIKS